MDHDEVASLKAGFVIDSRFLLNNFIFLTYIRRYSLYGTPLDPELFDVPPRAFLFTSNGAGVSLTGDKPAFNGDESDSLEAVGTNQYSTVFRGLLDVEPLHFICCSTSDGARVEKIDMQGNGFGKIVPPSAMAPANSASQFFYTSASAAPAVPASLAAVEQELQLLKVLNLEK